MTDLGGGATGLSLVLFSGLPGTGKSTLASRLALDLDWTLLRIDDLTDGMPAGTDWSDPGTWDGLIVELLQLVQSRLEQDEDVIVDSVFMDLDRWHARSIADEIGASFRPVHTYLSDEAIWRHRVEARRRESDPEVGVASWGRIQRQRVGYRPWTPGTALFLDTGSREDDTYAVLRRFVTKRTVELEPLEDRPFEVGRYHRYMDRPY